MTNEAAQADDAFSIDARANECAAYAKELKRMQRTNVIGFKNAIARLKQAALEEADTAIGAMAQGTLEELQIDSTEGLTIEHREELKGVFLTDDEDTYMGDAERFISLEEAHKTGELDDETLDTL